MTTGHWVFSSGEINNFRILAKAVPNSCWSNIRGSDQHRLMLTDFKNEMHPEVRALRDTLSSECVPRISAQVQSVYPTLTCYEFNVLRTIAGASEAQIPHFDVKSGTYALSVIMAWDEFIFDHCSDGTMVRERIGYPHAAIFSGACLHGGGATNYSEDTYRLFIIFTCTHNELPGNSTHYPDSEYQPTGLRYAPDYEDNNMSGVTL